MSRVLIVGSGFAGLNIAKGLGNVTGIDVTVVDRTNHHLFQPLLYQVAMAGVSPADIAMPIRSILKHQKNARVLLGEIARVDLANKMVAFDDGTTLAYDYVIVAVGAKTNFFGHEEWARYALGMKSI